jgi:prepilin-type N-terminal cleavage/methylation domain-containing protein
MHQKKSASRPFFAQSSDFVTASVRRVRTRVRAFTLIELLVVIVIIGILATISVAQFNKYQERAREAVGQAALKQLETGLVLARIDSQKYLTQITNDSCTLCEDECANYDLRNVPETNACYVEWKRFLDDFMEESGIELSGFYRDPWGSPYLLDENEHEPARGNSICVKDEIISAGPDGILYWSDGGFPSSDRGRTETDNLDNSYLRIPFFDPKCNQ